MVKCKKYFGNKFSFTRQFQSWISRPFQLTPDLPLNSLSLHLALANNQPNTPFSNVYCKTDKHREFSVEHCFLPHLPNTHPFDQGHSSNLNSTSLHPADPPSLHSLVDSV